MADRLLLSAEGSGKETWIMLDKQVIHHHPRYFGRGLRFRRGRRVCRLRSQLRKAGVIVRRDGMRLYG